jgi:hypothetical protein
MWPLSAFRYDDGIDATDVYLFDEAKGELELMRRDDALAAASAQGKSLVAEWPSRSGGDVPSCILAKVSLPLRWEVVPRDDQLDLDIDPRLWFDAPCGGRDFLLAGQGHTFLGRMTAWCPDKAVSYNVSFAEMGSMSDETRYFVLGFLSGNEPGPPEDEDGNIDPADLEAWRSATDRFRRTGAWYGRWGTCSVCGCVLLPDSSADRCHEHREDRR